MVLKNQSQEVNVALSPRVSRNETYMSDAIFSRLASFQSNVKKKQEAPSHPGGVWDTDDAMEVTESSATQLNDKEIFRQQLSMLTYSSENCVGVSMQKEDVMDTKQPYKSNNSSPLVIPAFQKEELVSKWLRANDKEGFGEIEMAISSKNQPEKLKKKNSEEVSVERSKRFRTGSISEVYPPSCASNNRTKTEVDMVSGLAKELSSPTPEPKVTGLPNEMSVQLQELRNLMSEVNNSHGLAEKPHNHSDAKEKKVEVVESLEKIKVGNSYQIEIDTLRRVTSILESLGTVNTPGNAVSYSVEIERLQRICGILKSLESSNSYLTTRVNPEVPQQVVNVPETFNGGKNMVAGEAVSFLNGIRSDDSKSIKSNPGNSFKDTSQSSVVPVWRRQCSDFTADDDKKSDHVSSPLLKPMDNAIDEIINGTLPWKPSGSPPPVAAFSGASVQLSNDGKLSGIVHVPTSPSRAANSTLLFTAKEVSENADAMDTTQAKNTAPPSPDTDAAFKALGPNTELEKMVTDDLLSNSVSTAAAFSGVAVPTAKDDKLSEMIPVSTSPSSGMDVETTRATNSVPSRRTSTVSPSKSTAAASQINTMQTAANVMNTASPSTAKNGISSPSATTAEPYKADKQKSLGGVTFPLKDTGAEKSLPNTPSTSPTKYIAPAKRNCNETQVGGNLEKPSSLRPYGGSPRRFNEQSQGGRANAARRSFFADGGGSRSVSTWQNWRIKDKSPPPRSDALPKNNGNATKMLEDCHDPVNKKMSPKPSEIRRSPKEEKVLNVKNQKMDKSASGSKPSEDPNAMFSLKVFNEDYVLVDDELMVPRNDLTRLTRKFPKLIEIVPGADEPDKLLELNAEAVKVFLR